MFKLDNATAIDLLNKRVDYWINRHIDFMTSNKMVVDIDKFLKEIEIERELYYMYYEQQVNNGVFESKEYSIKGVVDNHIINNLIVICPDHEDYEEIKYLYDYKQKAIFTYEFKSGNAYGCIEVEKDGYFLVSY